MANTSSAKKSIRVAARNRVINILRREKVKNATKDILENIDSTSPSRESFSKYQSQLDRAVKVGMMHKNKAARLKSNMNARLKAKLTK